MSTKLRDDANCAGRGGHPKGAKPRVKRRSEGEAPEPDPESEGEAPEEEDGTRTSGDQIGAQACRILAPSPGALLRGRYRFRLRGRCRFRLRGRCRCSAHFCPRVLLRTSALFDWVLPPASTANFRPLRPRTSVLFDRILPPSSTAYFSPRLRTLDIARSLRTHQPRPPHFLVTRKQAAFCITMDLFVRSQASERRTTPSERRIEYDYKRGTQPDDTLRIPSWHASDHPSLSLDYSVTSRIPSSGHASDHSSISPVIYHNCRCSSTCPLSGHFASRPADQPLSQTLNTGPLSQTYGTPSDQLRRAEHHHRGSTFSFHDVCVSTSNAYRHSLSSAPSSEAPFLSSSGASRPEYTYHLSSQDRRWKVLLQDTIRRLVRSLDPGRPRYLDPGRARPSDFGHVCSLVKRVAGSLDPRRLRSLSKPALEDLVRRAMELLKPDLARRRSGLSIRGASSALELEGSSATEDLRAAGASSEKEDLREMGDSTARGEPTARGNVAGPTSHSLTRSSPNCDEYSAHLNEYSEPHDWPASEGGGHDEPAGGVARNVRDFGADQGGLDSAKGALDSAKGALNYVSGDAFDDPGGFDDYAGGSVNDDPGSLDEDDNTSTISLLNGEPLADIDLCVSLHLSSSSTPYSHSSSWIKSWIAGVAGSRRGAREDSSESHRQGAREDSPRFASKREEIYVAKEGCPSSLVCGEKDSRVASKHVAWDVRKEEPSTSRGKERAVSKAVAAQVIALTR
ncbi:hypothetical protein EV715DRAFT_212289 [Schizophyllum commune]